MNNFKTTLLTFFLPAALVLIAALGYSQYGHAKGSQMRLCEMAYALCTSARCVPHPNPFHKGIALCYCDVEHPGPSMSTAPCSELQPTIINGQHVIYSTYSFRQFYNGRQSMLCPDGDPWTNCLNKRCIIDPTNPSKATCFCDIIRTGQFTTVGGRCNTATCKNSYWSGATLSDYSAGNDFLIKALHLKSNPTSFCPI